MEAHSTKFCIETFNTMYMTCKYSSTDTMWIFIYWNWFIAISESPCNKWTRYSSPYYCYVVTHSCGSICKNRLFYIIYAIWLEPCKCLYFFFIHDYLNKTLWVNFFWLRDLLYLWNWNSIQNVKDLRYIAEDVDESIGP